MRRLLWIALALVILAGLTAGLLYKYTSRQATIRVQVKDVENDIREHITVGTSRAAVESYLDQRRIPHSYVGITPLGPEHSRQEDALISDSSHSWLIRGDIQIAFKFDEEDKVTSYSVREIFIGP